jgi:hypothetical protein
MSNDFEMPVIKGNLPPALAKALETQRTLSNENNAQPQNYAQASLPSNFPAQNNFPDPNQQSFSPPQYAPPPQQQQPVRKTAQRAPQVPFTNGVQQTSQLSTLLEALKQHSFTYEEITLPSAGKFYSPEIGVPSNGVIHIRPMTGEEEQILATPRFLKKGQAVNMIFQKCIQESIDPDQLFSVDRTFLLIYLRGISYGNEYEVQIECPKCDSKFNTTLDLDSIEVTRCPEDVPQVLFGTLPKTGFNFRYRIATGRDETMIQDHREKMLKAFGENAVDDTMLYRMAQLIIDIEGVTIKEEIVVLLKKLPVVDANHLRNLINEPPFSLNTNIPIGCPSCVSDFEVDLPLESNFFFPKSKKKMDS